MFISDDEIYIEKKFAQTHADELALIEKLDDIQDIFADMQNSIFGSTFCDEASINESYLSEVELNTENHGPSAFEQTLERENDALSYGLHFDRDISNNFLSATSGHENIENQAYIPEHSMDYVNSPGRFDGRYLNCSHMICIYKTSLTN